jgi:trehalose 6-phosphate phosphatase
MNHPPRALDRLSELSPPVEGAHHLLLFLDFDGTLAPIVDEPSRAEIPAAARAVLNHLAARDDVTVSIMSGRSVDDVRRRIGIANLIYSGNHGLEINGQGLSFEHPTAFELRDRMHRLALRTMKQTAALEGVEVESKGLTASVHFRRAAPNTTSQLVGLLRAMVPDDDQRLEIKTGKKVYEIGPRVDWHKGRAALYVRERLSHREGLPIVLGDDATDEDMFTSLCDGITIRVDPIGSTSARYSLANPTDVREFLAWILAVRSERDREPARHRFRER